MEYPPPKELLVQSYLKSGKSLEELKTEHGINYRITNGKISLSYDQIASKESDVLAQQCRGLILRENTFEIVALPLFRFFNYGQKNAAKINWNEAIFLEKLDGSLIIVYFDKVQQLWMCATRSMPEAESHVDDSGITFTQLVDKAANQYPKISEDKYALNSLMGCAYAISNTDSEGLYYNVDWKDLTFCFELCSPYNRVVCLYEDIKLYLLCVRNNVTHEELDSKYFAEYLEVDLPKEYSFSDNLNMLEIIKSWNPIEHEGIVAKVGTDRVKIKNPSHIAYNHIKGLITTSWRGCVDLVLLGKEDDIIPIVSNHIAKKILKVKELVRKLVIQTTQDYDEINHIDDMKLFAQSATKKLWPGALFAIKRGKAKDVNDFIFSNDKNSHTISISTIDSILDLCEKLEPNFRNIL